MVKKRILLGIVCVALCLGMVMPVLADTAEVLLYDDADLLSASEEIAVQASLEQVSQTYQTQILIVTLESIDGYDPDTYIELLYDENGFGYGQDHDGVLLMMTMQEREYRILTNGKGDRAIGRSGIDEIGDEIVSDLSDGEYCEAFLTYVQQCEYYLNGYENGFPFDWAQALMIAMVIALVISLIVVFVLKGQLKSVRSRNEADMYVRSGSMHLTSSSDIYLYRNVTRVRIQNNSSGSGSRGGGSRSVGGGRF